uniref:Uncharacterized protein AlNc14C23G2366 n=1 Tax=Albugo laibachii Nc14 TaxID=890382 RepID=F0W667_9STRA|nr:conserved hypothetical protein [Albugo laibachii Nc14]|eukprot:CCA16609.1 conserved hypothetical protein [Albugo laibachii Nc14]
MTDSALLASMYEKNRRRIHFDVVQLQKYYHLPLRSAAERLGVCEAALKRICRRNSIRRWPYRQISSILRRMTQLETIKATKKQLEESKDFLLPHELGYLRAQAREEHREDSSEQEAMSSISRIQQELDALETEKNRVIASAHLSKNLSKHTMRLQRLLPEHDHNSSHNVSVGHTYTGKLHVLATACSGKVTPSSHTHVSCQVPPYQAHEAFAAHVIMSFRSRSAL